MKKTFKFKKIVIIGLGVYIIYTLVLQQKTLNAYKSDINQYETQIIQAKENNQELNSLKSNVDSTDYITQIAREKLEMYLPNERVYIDISK